MFVIHRNGSHRVRKDMGIFSLVLEAPLCCTCIPRGTQLVFSRLFPRAIPSPSLIGPQFFFSCVFLYSKGRCFGSNTKSNLALETYNIQLAPEETLETKMRVSHLISR